MGRSIPGTMACAPIRASAFLWVLTLCPPFPASAQTPPQEGWLRDLDSLVSQLEARHPDLYHTISRDEFRTAADALARRIPDLARHEIIIELARLLATVGDGHTLIPILWDSSIGFRRLPIRLVRGSDGLAVLGSTPELLELRGTRLIRIGEVETEEALDAVSHLLSRDNEFTDYQLAAECLTVPEILEAVGIVDDAEAVELTVVDFQGRERTVSVQSVEAAEARAIELSSRTDTLPLWMRDRDDRYWFRHMPDRGAVYAQFNGADFDKPEESVAAFGRRLQEFVRGNDVRRLVIDLRENSGGSRWRARHLLNALIRIEDTLGGVRETRDRIPAGRIFVLIGPNTFSAATQFALDLDLHTNAVFVGEPTGGRPNHYGEVGRFRLAESGIEVRHALFYHQASHPRDLRSAIFPDIEAAPTVSDLITGRDVALEAVWGFTPAKDPESESRQGG